MGNDGGSIPDRRDLVKNKPKAEQADRNNQTIAAWFFCALSKRPLEEPVVSCALGKMYNKDAILEYLLDKSAYGDGGDICGHIKSLKDVKTLRLTRNPSSDPSSGEAFRHAPFICPLTLKEMSGSLPFVYLTTCGCVFSAAGLKAVSLPSGSSSRSATTPPSDTTHVVESLESLPSVPTEPCPQCAKPFTQSKDVRTVNPGAEELEQMQEKMILAAAEAKLAKQASKKRKASTSAVADPSDPSCEAPVKRSKALSSAAVTGTPVLQPMMNPSISSVARKVTEELAEEEKKRKANMSSAVRSLYEPKDGKKRKETFMTMGTFTRYA